MIGAECPFGGQSVMCYSLHRRGNSYGVQSSNPRWCIEDDRDRSRRHRLGREPRQAPRSRCPEPCRPRARSNRLVEGRERRPDYVEAFKAHKRETGAGERKGADLAIEFKAVVSPDWLAEGGADPRDPSNPRVQQLVAEARAWAESWGGKGAVWAVRYDTDEKGAGVVDLFMSPVRDQAHKSGKSKKVISCRKAKQELLEAEQARDSALKTSGAAMQSSWARWCQQRLDARIERGQSKEETGREHIHAEVYAREAEKARAEALRAAKAEAAQTRGGPRRAPEGRAGGRRGPKSRQSRPRGHQSGRSRQEGRGGPNKGDDR